MKTAIFKVQLDTPFGLFTIAVDSTEHDARSDIYSAAYSEFPAPNGMLRIQGDVKKSNPRILGNMTPIKCAKNYRSGQWGWAKKEV